MRSDALAGLAGHLGWAAFGHAGLDFVFILSYY